MVTATAHNRAFRIFDREEGRMKYPDELHLDGVCVTAAGQLVFLKPEKRIANGALLWCSGQNDANGRVLFEEDVCRVKVVTDFGSLAEDYAVMKFVPALTAFTLVVIGSEDGRPVQITEPEWVGDTFSNPELQDKVNGRAKS